MDVHRVERFVKLQGKLKAYFDESDQRLPDGHIWVISGGIALADQWETVSREWRSVLDEFEVPHFHATDFYVRHRRSPYERLTDDDCEDLAHRLARVIISGQVQAPGRAVITDPQAHERHLQRKQRREWKQLLGGDPYFFCSCGIVEAVWSILNDKGLDVPVEFFFEQRRGIGRVIDWFQESLEKSSKNADIGARQKGLPELQAADFITYEARQWARWEAGVGNKPRDRNLLSSLPRSGRVWDARGGVLRELTPAELTTPKS